MRGKSRRNVVFSLIPVSLFLLSTANSFAIVDLRTVPDGSGSASSDINNHGQKPTFISNTILVKLTAQARASLNVIGEDVNPAATGLPSLDLICRDHGVKQFRSIITLGAHRD